MARLFALAATLLLLACGDDGGSNDAAMADIGAGDAPPMDVSGTDGVVRDHAGTDTPGLDGSGEDTAMPDTPVPTDVGGSDAAAMDTGATDGGSTVGMVCANDSNCTGAGETCCLRMAPSSCMLEADCDMPSLGIPCDMRSDCPSSRVCCQLRDDRFCTPRRSCAGFGGEEVP